MDVNDGLVPFFVVASCGGGVAGVCDDVGLVGQVAKHSLSLHF